MKIDRVRAEFSGIRFKNLRKIGRIDRGESLNGLMLSPDTPCASIHSFCRAIF